MCLREESTVADMCAKEPLEKTTKNTGKFLKQTDSPTHGWIEPHNQKEHG